MRLKKGDILLFLIPLALAVLALFLTPRGGADTGVYAEIWVNGEIVKLIDFTDGHLEEIDLDLPYHNVIRVENGRIGFVNADCPDKVCVRTGMVSKPDQVSVCIPSRAVIRISGGRGGVDAVAG